MPTVSKPALEVNHPILLTGAIMLAMLMQVLDTTIANVALPHMAASLGASQDEITWVLTSYIVAAAVATPLAGWAADRFGRRNVYAGAIVIFTVFSMLCGLAHSLPEMVLFRVAQGVAGAVLAPLAQSVILDINPREKMGQGMAIFGMGIMIGPIIGPTLGGWLTENMGWRYVFFINVPVGALALAGVIFFLPNGSPRARRFDFFGFAMLALAIGALQLLLDRGQGLDWFHSAECWIYLGLVITGFWVFVLHSLDTPEPFISLQVFTDRNFVMGMLFIFIIGLTLFSSLALLPPLLQGLLGYPVMTAGLVMAPRGIGTLISMAVVGRVSGKVDARLLVTFGISLSAFSLWIMTGFDTVMNMRPIITSGIIQGFGLGFVFVPLTTLTFATLSPKLRGDATALFSLVRNVGSGIGISIVSTVLARMIGVNHAELASRVTADNPAIREVAPALLHHSPLYGAMISGLVSRQSAMIAYIDNFLLMIFFTLTALPIVFLLRQPKHHEAGPVMEAMGE